MMPTIKLVAAVATFLAWVGVQVGPGGSVTGTIRLQGGLPAAGVRVAAMVVPGTNVPSIEASALASITQTDSTGRYRLENIPPGRYFVTAGPVVAPTFHPGTMVQSAATILTIGDNQALAGIDFAVAVVSPNAINIDPGFPVNLLLKGQVIVEDGSAVPVEAFSRPPGGPMMSVLHLGGNSGSVQPDGSFALGWSNVTAPAQFALNALPPGYVLKSWTYAGRDYGTTPVLIDAKSSALLLLTLGFQPVSTLPRVVARLKVLNIPAEFKATTLTLTSLNPAGPTVAAPLQPGGFFELPDTPIGAYRVGLRAAQGNAHLTSIVTIIRGTELEKTIDFRSNPFPESEAKVRSPFIGGRTTTITGVVTQKLTPISVRDPRYSPTLPPDRSAYFRMDVKDERTGAVSPWAVYVEEDWQVPRIIVGEALTVPGATAADGTNRFSADPF